MNSTINKTFYPCSTESLFLRYKKVSKIAVKLGSFLQCSIEMFLRHDGWNHIMKNFQVKQGQLHHIPKNILLWKLWVIISHLPCWQQDSLFLAGSRIYPQFYHRGPCPAVLICKPSSLGGNLTMTPHPHRPPSCIFQERPTSSLQFVQEENILWHLIKRRA